MDIFDKNSIYHVFNEVIRFHYLKMHSLLDQIGLYPGQARLLFVLIHVGEGQSQKELSEKLNIAPATLTIMLKRMEKAGYIYRKQDVEDQRISRVYTTKEGREVSEESEGAMEEISKACFNSLTDNEIEDLRKLLLKVQSNLEKSLNEDKKE